MVRYFRRSELALLAVALLLALVAGRGLAQEEPSVVITAPAEGEVLSGPDITVSVALSGFTISLPLEPAREPNKGHLAYFLDVEPFFDLPTPLGDDNIIHSGRLSETFVGVADGEHTIYVCLVYDDNTCIDPALTDSVKVTVGEPPPTPIPSPGDESNGDGFPWLYVVVGAGCAALAAVAAASVWRMGRTKSRR